MRHLTYHRARGTALAATLTLAAACGLSDEDGRHRIVDASPGAQVIELGIAYGDNQRAAPGVSLPQRLVVVAVNERGLRANNRVVWAVSSGGGQLTGVENVTDVNGQAAATLTLGPGLGENTVTVTADGRSVTFHAFAVQDITFGGSRIRAEVWRGCSRPVSVVVLAEGLPTDAPVTFRIEGSAPGVAASLDPAVMPGPVTASGVQSTLHLDVRPDVEALADSSRLFVVAEAGGKTARLAVDLLAVPAACGFSASVSPTALRIARGRSAEATVTLDRGADGFPSFLHLRVPETPPGVSVQFDPNDWDQTVSTMRVSVGALTPPGSYRLTILVTENLNGTTITVPWRLDVVAE